MEENIYKKVCQPMTDEELKNITELSRKFLEAADNEISVRKSRNFTEILDFLLKHPLVLNVSNYINGSTEVEIKSKRLDEHNSIISMLRDNGFTVYNITLENRMIEDPVKEIIGDKEYTLKKAVHEYRINFEFK